jgi:hypothetical protein
MKNQTSPSLEIGDLVFLKIDEFPCVGEVRAISGRSFEVKRFGNAEPIVLPKSKVLLYEQWLEKKGRSSKLKSVYRDFFGVPLQSRMPKQNLDRLTRILRKHHLLYDRDVTSANSFFDISRDTSFVTSRGGQAQRRGTKLSEDLIRHIPRWIVADERPPSSRDPLGWQADAEQLANQLLPGLSVFTSRVGYFFFLPWAIRQINAIGKLTLASRLDLLNRLERALVLCETLFHGDDVGACYHQGQRSKRRLLSQPGRLLKIPEQILKRQASTGGLPLYRTAMRSCGIWTEEDVTPEGLLPYRLTVYGGKMADRFDRINVAEKLFLWARSDNQARSREKLVEWGKEICFCSLGKSAHAEKLFIQGFLNSGAAPVGSVQDASIRKTTLMLLSREGKALPFSDPVRSLVGERPIAESPFVVEELLADDEPDPVTIRVEHELNKTVLLHYYSRHGRKDAHVFMKAATYELASLGLNSIFRALMEEVAVKKRVPVKDWIAKHITESDKKIQWDAPPFPR